MSPSGLNWRVDQPAHPAVLVASRKRADCPRPIFIEMRTSLRVVHDAGQADPDRQVGAAGAHVADPALDHRRVEADLADDARRHRRLGEHRLDGLLVADDVMALGVARDADLAERAAQLAHRAQQVGGAVELARGRVGVARRDEHLAHARREQPPGELLQVRAVAHQPGREVRHDGVAVRPPGAPRRPTVASRPLAGDAVTVTRASRGTWATTSSTMPPRGRTS